MYPIILSIHNIVRWVVLILGIIAAARGLIGWFGKKEWTETDRKFGTFFGIAMDTQLLLGLLLYFALGSPWTQPLLSGDMKTAMTGQYRFFGVEHVFIMVLGIVLAHLGSVFSRRAKDALSKHRIAAILFTIAVILILAGIPWARPLLRFG
jgi:hypothetical protein